MYLFIYLTVIFLSSCYLSTDPEIPWAAEGHDPEIPCFEAGPWEGQRRPGPESGRPDWGVRGPHVFHREPEQTGILYGSRKHRLLKLRELERNVSDWCRLCLGSLKFYKDSGWRFITDVCVLPPVYY